MNQRIKKAKPNVDSSSKSFDKKTISHLPVPSLSLWYISLWWEDELLSFDYSLDLVIYVVFKLAIATLSFWRSRFIWIKLTRRFYGPNAWRVMAVSCTRRLIWEIVSIKVRDETWFYIGFCIERIICSDIFELDAVFCF